MSVNADIMALRGHMAKGLQVLARLDAYLLDYKELAGGG